MAATTTGNGCKQSHRCQNRQGPGQIKTTPGRRFEIQKKTSRALAKAQTDCVQSLPPDNPFSRAPQAHSKPSGAVYITDQINTALLRVEKKFSACVPSNTFSQFLICDSAYKARPGNHRRTALGLVNENSGHTVLAFRFFPGHFPGQMANTEVSHSCSARKGGSHVPVNFCCCEYNFKRKGGNSNTSLSND